MSARKPHRWPICIATGKRRYGERKDAKQALWFARAQRATAEVHGGSCDNAVTREYRCTFCGGFHLTSQERRYPTAA
ncbi:MAG TPA: hypothetical protein PLL54_03825 [Dermatophilaceae bacterium]|nr:hypothetical protein [Dermatophilaceae bacterium]